MSSITKVPVEACVINSEESFQLLVESVKDYAIYMLDPTGVVISWNQGAKRIKGYSARQIIGQHFSCFYLEEDVRRGKPMQELEQAKLLGRYESEGQRQRKDGSCFWVNAVVTALYDEEQRLRGFAKVTRDITEQKQAEAALKNAFYQLEQRVEERTAELSQTNARLRQEIVERQQVEAALRQSESQLKQQTEELHKVLFDLRQAQTKLVQSEKMSSLGQLVAGMAHEINNPISFIHGNLVHVERYATDLLELLQLYQHYVPSQPSIICQKKGEIDLEFLAEDLPKLLASMQTGVDRIQEIMQSLHTFSRLQEAELKAVDIHAGIDSALLFLLHRLHAQPAHEQAQSARPEIQVLKEYGELPLVECDAAQLNQVFMHILNNAIDAIAEEVLTNSESTKLRQQLPTIKIGTQQVDSHHVQIRIADNGAGMSSQVQARLFDPFFTTKPVGRGTGLGMSVSYQIIHQHKGTLQCLSQQGQGTEFIITIPIHHAMPQDR